MGPSHTWEYIHTGVGTFEEKKIFFLSQLAILLFYTHSHWYWQTHSVTLLYRGYRSYCSTKQLLTTPWSVLVNMSKPQFLPFGCIRLLLLCPSVHVKYGQAVIIHLASAAALAVSPPAFTAGGQALCTLHSCPPAVNWKQERFILAHNLRLRV